MQNIYSVQELKKTSIVITSIYNPTQAIITYSKMKKYNVIVVGDKKTPISWHCSNVKYLPIKEHNKISKYLTKFLPYNHYSRKMIGYLHAIALDSDVILDTDDDNIPKKNWVMPNFENIFSCIPENKGFINIYQLYTNSKIWPRGLPLRFIDTDFKLKEKIVDQSLKVGIWQGLADEDPDVDAIYRLTNNKTCRFKKGKPVVLGKGTISPVNTQNTCIRKELFPLLYLPSSVTFRFTDILRGLIAQPIMWMYNFHLGFTGATVVQKRNQHNYMDDFVSEIPMYIHCEKIIEITNSVILNKYTIADNLFNAYEALEKNGMVKKKEMAVLTGWLNDLEYLNNL